jgi:hypothetical protein
MKRHPIPVSPLETVGVAVARARLGLLDGTEPRDIVCDRCDRGLGVAVRHHPIPQSFSSAQLVSLDETEHCRWCARPISAAGEAKAPLSGYVALARALIGDRVPGRPQSIGQEVA